MQMNIDNKLEIN